MNNELCQDHKWLAGSLNVRTCQGCLAAEGSRYRELLVQTRDQLERDFAIRCRCDFVTKLFAGIERCVGCRARDRIEAIDKALADAQTRSEVYE